jgi:hypothetical protein
MRSDRPARALAEGKRDLKTFLGQPTGEDALPIIEALANGRKARFLAVSVPALKRSSCNVNG